jgi:hypothetical protein
MESWQILYNYKLLNITKSYCCRVIWSLIRRFPNSLCQKWKHPGKRMDVVRKIIEFIKGQGKASQKAMVVPSGQLGQVGWR